jgi:multimeric flavodoxin WrbA
MIIRQERASTDRGPDQQISKENVMDILLLQGSPRKNGNTERICRVAMRPLEKAGHTIEEVPVGRLSVAGCRECFRCQEDNDEPACSIDDNMQSILTKMAEARLVVFAAPVFCWGFPAQLKAVLDRCYCLFKFEDQSYKVLIEGKRVALVVTAGGDAYDGADNCVSCYEALVRFGRLTSMGRLVVPSLGEPRDLEKNAFATEQARQFGEKLRDALKSG